MGLYSSRILPWLIDRGMRNEVMTRHRPRIPPRAVGRVLEIGIGAGRNFPFYSDAVHHLFGIEPSDCLRQAAGGAAERLRFPVSLIAAGAEQIPLDTDSIDTIVSTWSLCSIPAIDSALQEMRRVLKPAGRFLFMEHGLAPDVGVVRMQQRMAPVFGLLAGCNPTRQMAQLISSAGFRIEAIETSYLDGPRFLSYHYIGEARPA